MPSWGRVHPLGVVFPQFKRGALTSGVPDAHDFAEPAAIFAPIKALGFNKILVPRLSSRGT